MGRGTLIGCAGEMEFDGEFHKDGVFDIERYCRIYGDTREERAVNMSRQPKFEILTIQVFDAIIYRVPSQRKRGELR